MSGIAGIIYPEAVNVKNSLTSVLKSLVHRGSSVTDIFTYKNLELGICGNKISTNENRTVHVVLDGNIYNYQDIASELKAMGYRFSSSNQEQVIAYGFEAWGIDVLQKLDGDFAIAIFDKQHEQLYVTRDRIGNKPLYWYNENHYFLFASELKGIMASGVVPQSIALDSAAAYLMLGYIPQDMTPISKVNKLLPGFYLQIDLKLSQTIQSYWSYSSFFTHSITDDPGTAAKRLDKLLQASVKMRMADSKSPGCFVSGGLGSASVAYYMQRCQQKDFNTFSVGFQGQNEEDLRAASRVVNKLHLKNELGLITPKNLLDDFVSIAWHLDEPMADPNVIATWNLARLASESCHTVFSGMGSDELLAGHSRYTLDERKLPFLTLMAQIFHPLIQHALAPAIGIFSSNASYKLLRESKTNPWQAGYLQRNALCDEKLLGEIAPRLKGLFDLDILLHKFHNLPRVKSLVSSFIYIDVKTRLADLYSMQYDRLTSAFGLDWRAPFLDEYIIEYLAGFAEPENLIDRDTASCLKIILRDVFPSDVINRPKRTRKNFLRSWLEHTELPQIFPLLQKGVLVEAGIISPQWLESNLATIDKQKAAFPHLWAVLALEVWYRLYINFPADHQCHLMSLKQLLSKT